MHLNTVAVACVLVAASCKPKATSVAPPATSDAAIDRTCTEAVGHAIVMNESSLAMPATDAGERMAQGGQYVSGGVDVCVRQGWTVAIRNCLADVLADRGRTNECFRLLSPQQRLELATALMAVETRITKVPQDSAPAHRFPWLAP